MRNERLGSLWKTLAKFFKNRLVLWAYIFEDKAMKYNM